MDPITKFLLEASSLIFRPSDHSGKTADNLVKKLNKKKNIKSIWNIGSSGLPRVCVSSKLWYSKDIREQFLNWWKQLPKFIMENF